MKKITITIITISLSLLLNTDVFSDSLWVNSDTGTQSLFTDQKASKVGDVITILIVEATTATQEASSSRDRNSKIKGEVKDWSGIDFYHGPRTKVAQTKPIWEIDTANDFSGGGAYTGKYNIRGQLTTQVIEVLPNKNLVIEGTSEVWINRERNTIAVSGIVRPQDINTSNTVLSTQLANAKIRIIGEGPIHDKTGRGLFETLLDWLWPF